jgi:hypothetical protein
MESEMGMENEEIMLQTLMQANYYTIDAVFKRKSNDLQPTDSIVIASSQ